MKFSTKIRTFAILSVLTLSQIGAVISHGNTIDLTARNPQALSTFDHMSASASDTIRFVITNKSDSGISGAFNMVAFGIPTLMLLGALIALENYYLAGLLLKTAKIKS